MSVVALKPREDFELSDCERIATGLIVCVEGFRDQKISDYAAQTSARYLQEQLAALPSPRENLWASVDLLATVTLHWVHSKIENDGTYGAWRRIVVSTLDLVQTTMAREAGRMP